VLFPSLLIGDALCISFSSSILLLLLIALRVWVRCSVGNWTLNIARRPLIALFHAFSRFPSVIAVIGAYGGAGTNGRWGSRSATASFLEFSIAPCPCVDRFLRLSVFTGQDGVCGLLTFGQRFPSRHLEVCLQRVCTCVAAQPPPRKLMPLQF